MRANPAPDVIPGCLFGGLAKWVWIPYVGSTLYETLLFGLTVYRGAFNLDPRMHAQRV